MRLGLIMAVTLTLTGCERGTEVNALFTDYQQRLAAALEVDPPASASPANIAAFPEDDARLFDIPDIREGMLDIYALRECQIAALVANRNNQLGKVAAPSQHWLYELKLWRRLEACRHSAVAKRLDEEDRQRLERLARTKAEQMPMASWNALFGSEEWTGSFSRASGPLPPDALTRPDDALAALAYLRTMTARQLDPDWQPDSSTLEQHLKALREEPLSAQVLRSLQLATLRLEEANRLFDAADTESSCPLADAGRLPALRTQVDDELRPYLEGLTRLAGSWLGAVETLLNVQQVSREAIDDYRHNWLSLDNPEAPWQRFLNAREAHRQHWQRLMRRCSTDEEP
ncbi:Protein of unknown function (DUF3080) [Onishia taeanensis]|uniref:DUF3080 family protein n=2 Tax=Oceanospirillales TaxID=135619 RepID=A0A328XYD1_9GAMM|nr:Protein of unknown function (DUF3080) [Halomonas taeanensis]